MMYSKIKRQPYKIHEESSQLRAFVIGKYSTMPELIAPYLWRVLLRLRTFPFLVPLFANHNRVIFDMIGIDYGK